MFTPSAKNNEKQNLFSNQSKNPDASLFGLNFNSNHTSNIFAKNQTRLWGNKSNINSIESQRSNFARKRSRNACKSSNLRNTDIFSGKGNITGKYGAVENPFLNDSSIRKKRRVDHNFEQNNQSFKNQFFEKNDSNYAHISPLKRKVQTMSMQNDFCSATSRLKRMRLATNRATTNSKCTDIVVRQKTIGPTLPPNFVIVPQNSKSLVLYKPPVECPGKLLTCPGQNMNLNDGSGNAPFLTTKNNEFGSFYRTDSNASIKIEILTSEDEDDSEKDGNSNRNLKLSRSMSLESQDEEETKQERKTKKIQNVFHQLRLNSCVQPVNEYEINNIIDVD